MGEFDVKYETDTSTCVEEQPASTDQIDTKPSHLQLNTGASEIVSCFWKLLGGGVHLERNFLYGWVHH